MANAALDMVKRAGCRPAVYGQLACHLGTSDPFYFKTVDVNT